MKRGLVASPEQWRYSSDHQWLPAALPLLRAWMNGGEWKLSFGSEARSQVQLGNEWNKGRRMDKQKPIAALRNGR